MSAGILSMIIIRTLRKDIANYNRDDDIVRCCILIGCLPLFHISYMMFNAFSLFLSLIGRHNGGIWLEERTW